MVLRLFLRREMAKVESIECPKTCGMGNCVYLNGDSPDRYSVEYHRRIRLQNWLCDFLELSPEQQKLHLEELGEILNICNHCPYMAEGKKKVIGEFTQKRMRNSWVGRGNINGEPYDYFRGWNPGLYPIIGLTGRESIRKHEEK